MTEKDFLNMIRDEQIKLETKKENLEEDIKFYNAINSKANNLSIQQQLKQCQYELTIVTREIEILSDFLYLPYYEEIQVMSDAAICERKNTEINKLSVRINELKEAQAKLNKTLEQLKAQYHNASVDYGKIIEEKGKKYVEELQESDPSSKDYEGAISELSDYRESIRSMSLDEYRILLHTKQEEEYGLSAKLEKLMNSPKVDAIVSPVASDLEKAHQLAKLLEEYKNYYEKEMNVCRKMELCRNLPAFLEEKLYNRYYYRQEDNMVFDTEWLLSCVQVFEEKYFNPEKNRFDEHYTNEKLSGLVGIDLRVGTNDDDDEVSIDEDFLKLHEHIIGTDYVKKLLDLVKERDKLNNNIFTTFIKSKRIKELNANIKDQKRDLYGSIMGWYENLEKDVLGISQGIFFTNQKELKSSLKRCQQEIKQAKDAIAAIKEQINWTKSEMDEERARYKAKKQEIAQQIASLSGIPVSTDEVEEYYLMSSTEENLKYIANVAAFNYMRDLVEKVRHEAQKHAQEETTRLETNAASQLSEDNSYSSNSNGETPVVLKKLPTSHPL